MEAKLIKAEPVEQPPDLVTITMTQEEAALLKKFAGNVAGETAREGQTRHYYRMFGNLFYALNVTGIKSARQGFIIRNIGPSGFSITDTEQT